ELRDTRYDTYLDEAAEQAAAACRYWLNRYGAIPEYWQLFNEPLSGNGEVKGGTTKDLADLVERNGGRLSDEGCGAVPFVVASEETEEHSYESAAAILANPRARRYVGAIGYHTYPYGSLYVSIPRVLETSGAGRPDPGRIGARQRLRALGQKYGIPLWMTE